MLMKWPIIFLTTQRMNNAGVPIPSQPRIFPAVFPNVLIDQLRIDEAMSVTVLTREEIMSAALLKKPAFSEEVFTVSADTSSAYENPMPPHYAKHESNHDKT